MAQPRISLLFKFLTFQPLSQTEERDIFLRSAYRNINKENTEKYGLFASELAFYTGYTGREALAMYAEVEPYLQKICDIQDIVKRIEHRSSLIKLDAVIDCIEKHNLHFDDGTQEQADAIDSILRTLPENLQVKYGYKEKSPQMIFEA